MPRSVNAQRAVDLYMELHEKHRWTAATAWRGIARLLLSCEVYRTAWQSFRDVVVYVESNRFKAGRGQPNTTLRRAEQLMDYLAGQLNVDRRDLCQSIGIYWQLPQIRYLQPHNPAGHAFRSLVATALHLFGDPAITYEEQSNPSAEPGGCNLGADPNGQKVDVVARRSGRVVAIIAICWRHRHNRLGFLHRTAQLSINLRAYNSRARAYVVVGEFDGGRLRRLLADSASRIPNFTISATVHFAPQLIREGLQEGGTLQDLQSLEWLIDQTFAWE
jgi:hypothetical protein